MIHGKRILVLAPHADDGEFGCGGTLVKLIENDCRVFYIAFSICETSVPAGYPSDILAQEVRAATGVLGIRPDHLVIHHYPVRHFPQHRQEILENLVKIKHEYAPQLVFLPSHDDMHQDHAVIAAEGVRAFKHSCILGYELPWNNLSFSSTALVPLWACHMEKKILAIQEYRSQTHRNYHDPDFLWSLAKVRGVQAETDLAEAFQVIRWIIE